MLESDEDGWGYFFVGPFVLFLRPFLHLSDFVLPPVEHFLKEEVLALPLSPSVGEPRVHFHFLDPLREQLLLLANVVVQSLELAIEDVGLVQGKGHCSADLFDGEGVQHFARSVLYVVAKQQTFEVAV